jgi:hypothetical protein
MKPCLHSALLILLLATMSAHSASILDLQPSARSVSIEIEDNAGRRGRATLTSLNPAVNAWFLLSLQWGAAGTAVYHLENPRPREQLLDLDEGDSRALLLTLAGRTTGCDLWWSTGPTALELARRAGAPYASVCSDALYVRSSVTGSYTQLERTTNFLRDHVWGGDRIVTFVRENMFRDAYIERASDVMTAQPPPLRPDSPQSASIDVTWSRRAVRAEHLAIDIESQDAALVLGAWYPVRDAPGVFVSSLQPYAISASILASHRTRVNALDAVEGAALNYFVAFDLSAFDLGFMLGTDHPRLDWSPRIPETMHDSRLPGPDGIDSAAPLVRTGAVSPALMPRTVAAFAGGFKREHGAFRHGDLALRNSGTHYGFVEQGTVFSTLQPGLATMFVRDDGSVGMKTWATEDIALMPRIKHARQNGVPLIEPDPLTAQPVPGALVNQWGAGNWSGSQDEQLRTLRAGACLQQSGTRRFLIYGYFSSATPSALARAFQAYRCEYAMHLDMNALEHTYLAVYTRRAGELRVQHLIEGMAEVDRKVGANTAPRFLAFADNRDFFYLVRRSGGP